MTLGRMSAKARNAAIVIAMLSCVLPLAPSSPGEEPAAQEPQAAPSSGALFDFPVHGSLSLRYLGRFTDDDADQDLLQILSVDAGAPERNRVTLHAYGRITEDIDGKSDKERFFVFDNITDTFKSSINARLYHAYLDVHRVPLLELVRVGRQPIHDTPVLAYFDGGRFETHQLLGLRLKIGAYGGVPVHLFESSPGGDLLVGSFLQARPWKGGKARVDWMHARDRTSLGTDRNDLFGASIWQDVGHDAQLHARYTFLEDRSRDVLARGTYRNPELDFTLQGSYYELIEPQRDLALELDPYFSAAFDLSPYRQTRWLASKGFGEHFVLEAGFDLRRLKNASDEATFNRDFERYFIIPTLQDLPLKGLSASLTGEMWDSRGRDIFSAGADLSYRLSEKLKASAGTFYSLYKYDYFAGRERNDVQTYYFKIRYKWAWSLESDVQYEFEDDDFDQYHVIRGSLTWSF